MTKDRWAALVPELLCRDLTISLAFYREVLGFSLRFARLEDRFAYLDLDGAELMLEEISQGSWLTHSLEPPFGRGINLQIEVPKLAPLLERLAAQAIPLFREPVETWYRDGQREHGQVEFLVQDPDGYLLRFVEVLGVRPIV